eukprot:g36756.t1
MIDEGKVVDVVGMDFSKTFDKVLHGRLVQKLKSYGIRGELAKWIQNWLSRRRHRVAVERCFSERRAVTSGFPQGSVLGPLLFVICINDLEENVAGLIGKFADDTKIGGVVDSEEDCQRIQRDINQLEAWQMEFNPDKCEVMRFGRSSIGGSYMVNGRTVRSIDMQRGLDVQIHRSLKVAAQVDKVVEKVCGMLAFIGRGIEYKDRQVMLQLYRILVGLNLEHHIQFWSPHYQKVVDALERVQKRFTRMLPGMGYFSYE